MMARAINRIREFREMRGLTQLALATMVKITRQSLFAIESGRVHPSVDIALRLAQALHASVEELFSDERPATLSTSNLELGIGDRAFIAYVAGHWHSTDVPVEQASCTADAVVAALNESGAEVELLRTLDQVQSNLMIMGCALGLGALAGLFNQKGCGAQVRWVHRSSTAALQALAHGHTHVAGLHLLDDETGENNVADVRRMQHNQSISLITLAHWEAGLIFRSGDRSNIRRIEDLQRSSLRIVGREQGSGAQRLLERSIREAGLPAQLASQPHLCVAGHYDVARAIAWGAADVGIATRDAAQAFGLVFVALARERYDLALLSTDLSDARIQRLMDLIQAPAVRRELAAFGYDLRDGGDHVCDVQAV